MIESRSKTWLLSIVLLALVLRVGFVFWLQNKLDVTGQTFLIAGDAEGYWELGRAIVNGDDYSVHQPPRYVHRMPGLPVLLAASMSLFGESFLAARLMLATLGAMTCWLVYLLGKRIHSPTVGLIAAGLQAVSPAAIGFSALILSETAFGFAMLLSLLVGHATVSAFTQKEAQVGKVVCFSLLTGLSLAVGVYMKPSWILLGPIIAVLFAALLKPRLLSFASAALVIAGMVLALLPWGIRNQIVSGHFKLTTFWMGPSLYDGLNPNATGDSDMRFFDEDQLTLEMSEYEVDQEYKRRAISFAQQNPLRVAELAASKLWRYWKPWPNAEQFKKPWIGIGLCLYTIPLFALAVWGGWVIRDRFWSIVILAGPIFYFAGLHMIFVSSLRYRLPAEAPLSLLTAIGLVSMVNFRQKHSKIDSEIIG